MLEKTKSRNTGGKNFSPEKQNSKTEISCEQATDNDLTRLEIPTDFSKKEKVPGSSQTEKVPPDVSRREAFNQARYSAGAGLVKLLRTCNLLEASIREKIFRG